jgi:hypothetical protein
MASAALIGYEFHLPKLRPGRREEFIPEIGWEAWKLTSEPKTRENRGFRLKQT